MLAFLGAIICIIASIQPASNGAVPSSENKSVSVSDVEGGLGALHGADGTYTGLDGLSGLPITGPQTQTSSQFLCTPLVDMCSSVGSKDASVVGDVLFLQTTAEQLRQTALQQKNQILSDQQTIKDLTGKLSQCENGLELSFRDTSEGWGSRKETMGDLPVESDEAIEELERAVITLKDRIEKLEHELQTKEKENKSSVSSAAPDSLHSKIGELEEQLVSKILQLEKDRASFTNENDQQKQHTEKDLNDLHHRITELEQGNTGPKFPEGYKVVFPVRTNYMYGRIKKSLPALYAFTACIWLKPKGPGGIGTPFSYSVPGQANEIVLLEWGQNPIELLINDKGAELPFTLKEKFWHHVCITWTTRDGKWEAYHNGELQGSGDNLSAWHHIKPNGVLILGQDQDTLGGRFDATQAFIGEIAQFNMWDHILTPEEIFTLANCSLTLTGNIVAWDDKSVDIFGGATKWALDKCEERLKP
ncbi:neuronal pentraxin receptor [Protopterus annectens]|uniref:neuronal pentraxin receptor n=1 Tax=Protopterus annectens TaxID=7888 RepID=UPI001CF98A09|nr:neuronal pentraxin receptor [Protopterus annectens]